MKKALLILSLWVMVSPLACQQLAKKNSDGSTGWSSQMQSLDHTLKNIIPLVYNRKEFADPRNEKKIRMHMKSFSKSIHNISPKNSKKLVGEDPLFNFTLNRFRGDLKRATESFDSGHKEYTRSIVQTMVGHCFRCHTRNAMGPEFKGGVLNITDLKLDRLSKVDLLVAARRYDEALVLLEKIIGDSKKGGDFAFEMDRALRRYLSLTIRVKKSFGKAEAMLERLSESKTVPYYLVEYIRQWEKSLKNLPPWLKQKKTAKKPISAAKKMIRRARNTQEYRKDHSADVEYLAASAILHDGLMTKIKQPSQRTEAYFLLGGCYEALGDLGYWSLNEFYYEACIREWPRGPWARRCYERLEESVFVGYSGSSGIHVPYHEKKRLEELKNLIFIDPL